MRPALRVAASIFILAIGVVAAVYYLEIHAANRRVEGRSTVIQSPYGDIEFSQGGAGTPVLIVHGSGGGFDQGELVARAVFDNDVRWIAPSRFGYLKSTVREGATFDEQAHAFAYLLDRLGIEKVTVVALSHGGPSALLLAALHPNRVSSVVLISCGVAASSSSGQQKANDRGSNLVGVFRHNALYWGMSKVFRTSLMEMMGANRTVIRTLTADQRSIIDELIDDMNPVELRTAGVEFDNGAQMPNERVAAVRAPTLIFHARDDGLQLFHNAEYAAAHIAGSELVAFDRGGHLLLAVEQSQIRQRTRQFLATHTRL